MSPLKRAVARLAAATRLPPMIHRRLYPQDVAILMYHAVVAEPLPVPDWCFLDAGLLHGQLRYLAREFDVVPLGSLSERMKAGISRPTAVITFDDGYQNNSDVAFPMLKEFGLPAAVFLTTGLIDTDDTVWFCRLHRALIETCMSRLEWSGRSHDLVDAAARARASAALQSELKVLAPHDLGRALANILERLGEDMQRTVEKGSPFRMLCSASVREMAASGLVEFGAHTPTHRILSRLAVEEQRRDVFESVAATSRLTGTRCRLFAYPNGRAEDYQRETVSLVEESGVLAAVTTMPGPNPPGAPLLELRRYGVGHGTSQAAFELTVHHIMHRFRAAG